MLTFIYTHCQDTCPVTATTIRGALDDLGHDVPALAVSVDPAGDTPASAPALPPPAAASRTTGCGSCSARRAQLEPVWRAYGVQPQGRDFDHSAYVLLIDRRGRQRIGFPVDQLTSEGLAHDMRRLEREPAEII